MRGDQPGTGADPVGPGAGARTGVSGRRLEVLTRLRAAARPLGIAELATVLDVHPNTVRFHLEALLAAGLVRRADSVRRAPGRPAQLFAPAAAMDGTGPRRFGQLARVLAAALDGVPDGPARALEQGRVWGREVAAGVDTPAASSGRPGGRADAPGRAAEVDRLVALLDDLDFDPVVLREPDPAGDRVRQPADAPAGDAVRIGLRRCPFLEVSSASSAVVCPVHLGLMQGAMEVWSAPVTVDRLDPFAQPDLCVAHLAAVRSG